MSKHHLAMFFYEVIPTASFFRGKGLISEASGYTAEIHVKEAQNLQWTAYDQKASSHYKKVITSEDCDSIEFRLRARHGLPMRGTPFFKSNDPHFLTALEIEKKLKKFVELQRLILDQSSNKIKEFDRWAFVPDESIFTWDE